MGVYAHTREPTARCVKYWGGSQARAPVVTSARRGAGRARVASHLEGRLHILLVVAGARGRHHRDVALRRGAVHGAHDGDLSVGLVRAEVVERVAKHVAAQRQAEIRQALQLVCDGRVVRRGGAPDAHARRQAHALVLKGSFESECVPIMTCTSGAPRRCSSSSSCELKAVCSTPYCWRTSSLAARAPTVTRTRSSMCTRTRARGVRRTRDGAHPHRELLGQARVEQRGLAGPQVDQRLEAGVPHAEEVPKVALLAEQRLDVYEAPNELTPHRRARPCPRCTHQCRTGWSRGRRTGAPRRCLTLRDARAAPRRGAPGSA